MPLSPSRLKSIQKALAAQPKLSRKMIEHIKACPYGDDLCCMKAMRDARNKRCANIAKLVTKITA